MIRRISDRNDIDCKALSKTHLGKKMLSYLEAYGTDYDFCRFYVNESGSVLLIINSTLLISGKAILKKRSFAVLQLCISHLELREIRTL